MVAVTKEFESGCVVDFLEILVASEWHVKDAVRSFDLKALCFSELSFEFTFLNFYSQLLCQNRPSCWPGPVGKQLC